MKPAGIFQDLEHLYDFQRNSYGGLFVFQNEAKILHRQVFIAINIPGKFGEDIFINEWDIKVYVKTWGTDRRTYVRKAFYNLPTTAFGHRQEIIMYDGSAIISCGKVEYFSPFVLFSVM